MKAIKCNQEQHSWCDQRVNKVCNNPQSEKEAVMIGMIWHIDIIYTFKYKHKLDNAIELI